jgi:hypothetical protein
VAIPTDRNVVQKEAEKKLTYRSLCMEICRMWNRKCVIIHVTIGVSRMAAKGLLIKLKTIIGTQSIDSLKKTHILGDISHKKKSSVV